MRTEPPTSTRSLRYLLAAASTAALSACVVSPTQTAPIEDRSKVVHIVPAPAPAPAPAAVQPREAHGGMYVAQAGDTVYSVALAFGRDFRDIARWNGLDEKALLQPGQTLRVEPPPEETAAEASPVAIAPAEKVESRPLAPSEAIVTQPGSAAAAPTPGQAAGTGTAPAAPPSGQAAGAALQGAPGSAAGAAAGAAPPAAGATSARPAEPQTAWMWPSSGELLEHFEETNNKGIDIAGSVGDPVLAANDGQVVYSGSGLHGYGNLVIIKHTDDYVSAYAHNSQNLVTQGEIVKRGQHIADLGMTDASSPRLHFEIRRRGTPVDPLAYLPPR